MTWELEPRGAVVVVRMRSNPVNCMNGALFDDVHRAFDTLDSDHRGRAIVLTGEGATFSAGLDLREVFGLFAGKNEDEIGGWFERFRAMILRVLVAPRFVVAAINGHAFAGGVILACACDQRLAARGASRFALNEVPIGIAFPATYLEIARHALGTRVAGEAALTGRMYDVEQAHAAGLLHAVVEPAELLDSAVGMAEIVGLDQADAFAVAKKALLAPLLERLEGPCRDLDKEALRVCTWETSRRAQLAAVDKLKKRKS